MGGAGGRAAMVVSVSIDSLWQEEGQPVEAISQVAAVSHEDEQEDAEQQAALEAWQVEGELESISWSTPGIAVK